MDLEDFVRESLKQIMNAVSEASKDTRIAPHMVVPESDSKTLTTLHSNAPIFPVEFDVAVTAIDKSTLGGGGGIVVLSVATLKGEKSKTMETTSVSRIKFSVPVCYRF